jgi:DNA-binding beta-propeller fold protein YncE
MRFALLAVCLASCAGAQPVLNYQPVPNWPSLPPNWNFLETPGVAVDSRGHVFVIHRGMHPVMEFAPDGRFLRSFGDGLYDRAHSIRIDPQGNIWTVDDGSHTVLQLDPSGRVKKVFGRFRSPSSATGGIEYSGLGGDFRGNRDETVVRFFRPTDVAFGPDGSIYVSDGYGNSRVVKFTRDGKFVKEWGRRGTGQGEFHIPHSIVVDRQGNVYVADRENYRVQVFDADGKFKTQWTGLGAPWGLDISRDGYMYMVDGYNNRVLKLTLDGKVVGRFGSQGKLPGQFHYCHQIAVGGDGAVYTAEILNWRPQKFVLRMEGR